MTALATFEFLFQEVNSITKNINCHLLTVAGRTVAGSISSLMGQFVDVVSTTKTSQYKHEHPEVSGALLGLGLLVAVLSPLPALGFTLLLSSHAFYFLAQRGLFFAHAPILPAVIPAPDSVNLAKVGGFG